MREVTKASVAHEKPELSTESVMKRPFRNCQKNLNFKRAGATPQKKRCVREMWCQSARVKATENVREIDGCPRQLTLREIVSKNAAP